jgi:isopentenyl-diphosphate delta-isomerase
MPKTVILVNEKGEKTGTADLIQAHTGSGLLHRAFSVYVFRNSGQQILIQRRSEKKMLWPLIWANTCCSHPQEGEDAVTAGKRRLFEELGFSCSLATAASYVYRAEDPKKRGVEHEHVTLLVGSVDDVLLHPNADEVAEHKWINVDDLQADMAKNPDDYAPWFHLGLPQVLQWLKK